MLPLFYTQVVGIDSTRDADKKIRYGRDVVGYCANSHICPCLAAEFSAGGREFPVVFIKENGKSVPVFLLGLRPRQNLFVENEAWTGVYLPRYLQRYPFIIAEVSESQQILAIDESARDDAEGLALFTAEGERSAFLTEMVRLSEVYAADARLSDAFAAKLDELDLLQPISVEVTGKDGKYGWSDIFAVDQQKLKNLPDEQLLMLARGDYLAAIHAHLMSLQSFGALKEREDRLAGPKAA